MAKREKREVDYSKGDIVQPGPSKTERKAKVGSTEKGTASECLEEIGRYEKQFKKWETRAKEIVDRYRDERDQAAQSSRSFNILWSNVQILKPTLYARTPKPEVVRRFKDSDKIARIASEIAERAVDVEIEYSDLDDVLQQCVTDRLLGGRGQAWVSYDPEFKGDDDEKTKTNDALCVDYVDYRDFGHSPVPVWAKVTKVWRWKYFNKEEFTEQFGTQWIDRVEFSERKTKDKDEPENLPEARIAEVWDKDTRKVYWASKAVPDYLDEYDDPLKLEDFFPCPKPLYATMTNNTLVPVPDFYLYQDQANEVDKLTGRINRLTDALKVTGVYDQSIKSLQDLLDPRGVADNSLVAVDMNDLTGKGGLIQAVQLVDISQVITTIQECYTARAAAIQVIYEITGISDVIRGATDPRETAKAQDIKAQFGGTRIKDMQQEVARFARGIVRIMCELVVEMYDPQKLWTMTNAESFLDKTQPPQQPGMPPAPPQPDVQSFVQAIKLLKDDKLRSYRVDIETDSTISLDEAQSKQEATEFVTAIGAMLEKSMTVVQQAPFMAPVVGEMLLFATRRFKAGRTMEATIERAVQAAAQQAQQPKPPSPEQIKAEAEQKKIQMQMQAEQASTQADLQAKQQEAQIKAAVAQAQMQMDERMAQQEMQLEAMKARLEMDLERQKHEQEMQQDQQKAIQDRGIAADKARQAEALASAKSANTRPS